jgi:hypothetical protein
MNEQLDKSVFKKRTVYDASKQDPEWLNRPLAEKLQAAYQLSVRVYGYHPDYPPKMDRQMIHRRIRS